RWTASGWKRPTNWLVSPRSTPSGGAFIIAKSRTSSTSRPMPQRISFAREFIRRGSDTAQESDAAYGQPLSDQNVAAMQKDCSVRRNELAWCEFISRLPTSRTYFAVCRSAVAELSDNVIFAIEDAHLTVEVGANHPFTVGIEVTGHAQPRIILDGAQVFT